MNDPINITTNTPVFYINLEESKDRNNNISVTLDKLGFNTVKRIEAVNTRTIEKANVYKSDINHERYEILKKDIAIGKRRFYGALTLGSIGCFKSHMNIYKHIIDNDISYAIIFEDDIEIDLDKNTFWNNINKLDIPKDTDYFLLSATYYEWIREIKPSSNTATIGRFTGTYAYIITNKGAKILHDNLKQLKYQIDFQISIIMKAGLIKIYGYTGPKIIKHGENTFGTTIQNITCDKNCKMFDLDAEAAIIRSKHNIIEGFSFNYSNNYYFKLMIVILILMLALLINYI
jgi:GR25 family glycosyltransferase involved in LPS biosynthesis